MRNPLHFSSALLVKKAANLFNMLPYTPQYLNSFTLPPYIPQYSIPRLNAQQIQGLMMNNKAYPTAQQPPILETINPNFGQYNYNSRTPIGIPPTAPTFTQGQISDYNDAMSLAKEVLAPAPVASPINIQQPQASNTNSFVTPKNLTPTDEVAINPAETKPTSAPTQPPAPVPRKEGLIEGRPASQWLARNKARQQRDINSAKKTSMPSSTPSGTIYDSVSGQMVPKGFNRYNTSTPTQSIQTRSVQPQSTPSTPAAPVAQPLAPEAQKMLNAYKNTPAGKFQNMSRKQLRAGVASDVYGRK